MDIGTFNVGRIKKTNETMEMVEKLLSFFVLIDLSIFAEQFQ